MSYSDAWHEEHRLELKEYYAEWYRKYKAKKSRVNRVRRGRAKALIQAARGPCVDCGAKSEHLHHVDPSTKLFPLGTVHGGITVTAVEEELAKCVPLCSDCHAKRHKEMKADAEAIAEGR